MKNIRPTRWLRRSGCLLAVLLASACGASGDTAPQPGAQASAAEAVPAHVLLAIPAGKEMPAGYAETLGGWERSGLVADALLIKQFDGPEPPFYSSLAVLDFDSESDYERWNQEAAPKLGADVIASRVDVLTHAETTPRDSSKAVFVVGTYESLVSAQAYQEYTDAYIVPNMANQKFSGIMTRYTMYLEREPSGEQSKPKTVLLTEYRNDAEFARKKDVKDSYKQVLLAHHPEWKRINDTKIGIRNDLGETLARQVVLP